MFEPFDQAQFEAEFGEYLVEQARGGLCSPSGIGLSIGDPTYTDTELADELVRKVGPCVPSCFDVDVLALGKCVEGASWFELRIHTDGKSYLAPSGIQDILNQDEGGLGPVSNGNTVGPRAKKLVGVETIAATEKIEPSFPLPCNLRQLIKSDGGAHTISISLDQDSLLTLFSYLETDSDRIAECCLGDLLAEALRSHGGYGRFDGIEFGNQTFRLSRNDDGYQVRGEIQLTNAIDGSRRNFKFSSRIISNRQGVLEFVVEDQAELSPERFE